MHIVLTFPLSFGLPGGGPYAYIETARHLNALGARVTLMPVQSSGLRAFPRPPVDPGQSGQVEEIELRELGINVTQIPAHPLHFALDGLSLRKAVNALLRWERIDAVIGWHHEAAFLSRTCRDHAIPLAKRAAGSYILSRRNRRRRIQSGIIMWLLKRSFRDADAVWATSAFTSRQITHSFSLVPEKVRVIPEGVNPLFFAARRRRDDNEPISRFLFFGSWGKSKGLMDALTALGRATGRGWQNWQLHVAGWGDEDGVWRAAREHGVLNQIEVLGWLDHQGLLKALEWAQIALLPSKWESFGLAVAEAQASGVPVIAYATGAVPDMIQDGETGWLVPLNRTDLLASAIIEAMENPPRTYRLGLAGRENIAARYSWERTANEMLTQLEVLRNR